jgi:dihydropteroate synthase
MIPADLPPSAHLYLRPTGFGSGTCLAGGQVRFGAVEFTARIGRTTVLPPSIHTGGIDQIRATLPPPLATRLDVLWSRLVAPRPPLMLPTGALDLSSPAVMGILNVTPDSFSDGGRHATPAQAVAAARAMYKAGAALIDIGGESTRPGATEVGETEELARVGPVLNALGKLPLSIDTRHARIMQQALAAGAGLVNDVSALTHDPEALALIATTACPVVLMHAQGTPQSMQHAPHYGDVLLDVFDWLEARIEACVAGGIARERIIVDPGIGFGKTAAHNLALIRGIAMLHALGCPVLLGVSRKKMIDTLGGGADVTSRLGGSLALALAGLDQGVQLLRVHDVPATVQAVRLWRALQV